MISSGLPPVRYTGRILKPTGLEYYCIAIMSKLPAKRGASCGAKRSAGTHEAQPRRSPPALRHQDDDGDGNEQFSSFFGIGDDLVFRVMEHLGIESLAKLEMVAKVFKRLAVQHWKAFDEMVPVGCRSSSSNPRIRAIRFHLASKLADSALKDLPRHGCVDIDEEMMTQNRNHKPTFEYFVRFVDVKNDKLFAQGFTRGGVFNGSQRPFNDLLQLPLDKLDLSAWSDLHALMPMQEFDTDVFQDVSIAVVAVRRHNSRNRIPLLSLAFVSDEWRGPTDSHYLGQRGTYRPMLSDRKNCRGVHCSILCKGSGTTNRYLACESSLTLALHNGWKYAPWL